MPRSLNLNQRPVIHTATLAKDLTVRTLFLRTMATKATIPQQAATTKPRMKSITYPSVAILCSASTIKT